MGLEPTMTFRSFAWQANGMAANRHTRKMARIFPLKGRIVIYFVEVLPRGSSSLFSTLIIGDQA